MRITPKFYFGMGKGFIEAGIGALVINVILYHVDYYDADIAITVTMLGVAYILLGILLTILNSSR